MRQEKVLKAASLGHEISAREAWKLFALWQSSSGRPSVSPAGAGGERTA
jgi:molybdenum-dependent DNA-binding transcriptional regulator ModE